MTTSNYFKIYALFALGVALLVALCSNFLPGGAAPEMWWSVFGFFLLLNPVLHGVIMGKNSDNGSAFVRRFMLVTTLKFMLFLAIVVVVFLGWKPLAKNFLVVFLFHYFLFTAFETVMLYRSMKPTPR
jgi:hypothetical protein